MKAKDRPERSSSIFGEEEATVAEVTKPQAAEMPTEDRKRLTMLGLTVAIAIVIVALVLVVGIISGMQEQKRDAAEAPRESTPTFYGEITDEDKEDDAITSILTEAYYTAENGMWVTVEFYNGTDSTQRIIKTTLAIYNDKDGKIADAATAGIDEDYVVAAGESNELRIYFKPEYVFITDDPLQTLRCEITTEYEAAE